MEVSMVRLSAVFNIRESNFVHRFSSFETKTEIMMSIFDEICAKYNQMFQILSTTSPFGDTI